MLVDDNFLSGNYARFGNWYWRALAPVILDKFIS